MNPQLNNLENRGTFFVGNRQFTGSSLLAEKEIEEQDILEWYNNVKKTIGSSSHYIFQSRKLELETETPYVQIDYSDFYNTVVRSSFYAASLRVITQTPDVRNDYNNFCLFNPIRSLFKSEPEPKKLEQEALFSIAMEFSKVEKVKSIYFQKYRDEIQIYIILSISQYDSSLMDILLDIEYDIRKRYTDIVFEFSYPPATISEEKDFIHPHAQRIYAR